MPVVAQVVQIFTIVGLVVQADSKVGLVLLEMVHAVSVVGLVCSLVQFVLQFFALLEGVIVVWERWMQNGVFHIKVRFCNDLICEENDYYFGDF